MSIRAVFHNSRSKTDSFLLYATVLFCFFFTILVAMAYWSYWIYIIHIYYIYIFQLCILRYTCSKHDLNMSSIQKSWIIDIQHGIKSIYVYMYICIYVYMYICISMYIWYYMSLQLSTTTRLACKSFARPFWWYTQKSKCRPDATSTIFINLGHLCPNWLANRSRTLICTDATLRYRLHLWGFKELSQWWIHIAAQCLRQGTCK